MDPGFTSPPKTHTLGPQCRLAPVTYPFTPSQVDDIPPVKAQYFYTSLVPIDDPLSTSAAAAAAASDTRYSRGTLRPFSPGDNNALENAWLGLADDHYRRNHASARLARSPSPSTVRTNEAKLSSIIRDLASKHTDRHASDNSPTDPVANRPASRSQSSPSTSAPACCPELATDVDAALRASFCATTRKHRANIDSERVAQEVLGQMRSFDAENTGATSTTRRSADEGNNAGGQRWRAWSGSSAGPLGPTGGSLPQTTTTPRTLETGSEPTPARHGQPREGISGRPFVRVSTPESTTGSPSSSLPKRDSIQPAATAGVDRPNPSVPNSPATPQPIPAAAPSRGRSAHADSASIPVGVSRLHEVSLPALQMKPIYWSPVNDIATVLRATWFYRDDMRPVDTAVANQLEAGYRELKPHTETWNDEIRSAIDVGPLGEEKVSHPLWPNPPKRLSRRKVDITEPPVSNNPSCAARCYRGEAAAEGTLQPTSDEDVATTQPSHKKYEQYHVIYKDEKSAFLLKPSLKPSAYYGRRPITKIAKGATIGIPVVRGFDYHVWLRKHPNQLSQQQQESFLQPDLHMFGSLPEQDQGQCRACETEKLRGQVSDLVLVVHGIGQKLAERVETYHFTHAINSFRRAMNIELRSEVVRSVLRQGQNGVMVLPVNWRQNLSFEDGGPLKEEDKSAATNAGYRLKDIEPKTIPAVRSMISDVMFDIPFYMSHHKPKMVSALVAEANRVYRLWCRNNPGFSEHGRVHLIGHSLGSVMSIEVLSRQPTVAPKLQVERPLKLDHFEFDTKNLFLLGSPAAFFLLLERGALLPRRGRKKPGADPVDTVTETVVGNAGAFGCIAVDNIYNVLAREDAVAYLLNGTVDAAYAASLKTAYVPSVSASLLQSMGNAVMSIIPGVSSSTTSADPALARPPTTRLPSQLELEVHDFTREEVAEKKAFLLNDNGQIDYFLRSGGGPLELQYLNMLSAHTSYWANHDLIRMLCVEIGRTPGRETTLPAMRAVKATKRALKT